MENQNCQIPEGMVLQHLGKLRKMIVHHHDVENLSEFVLHELCKGPCFQVNKAAYFINNPDFNLLHGVAGYDHQESNAFVDDVWNNQQKFTTTMQTSSFNQKVRKHNKLQAFTLGHASEKYMADQLAEQLEIVKPAYHVWNLKHDNHGLLIYEPSTHHVKHTQDHLLDALYYLSFCPVY